MAQQKIKFIDGNMYQYEVYDLVDKYDAILNTPTEPFNFQSPQINAGYFAMSLAETMIAYDGMGISANQVGKPYRVCSINMGDRAFVLFNPKIVNVVGSSNLKEGCLSFPGLFLKIPRYEAVTVQFQGITGEILTQSFEGVPAICVQHEIDHLDGICYTKKVSPIVLEREKNKIKKNIKKINKIAKRQAELDRVT